MAEQEREESRSGNVLLQKWHGVPVWAWTLGGTVAVVGAWRWWKDRQGSAASKTTSAGTSTSTGSSCYDINGNLVPCTSSSSPLGSGSSGGLAGGVGGWYGGGTSATGVSTTTSTGSPTGSSSAGTTTAPTTQTGTVPQCVGLSAGAAHNAIVAAGLKPTAPAGQKATWTCTGTDPAAGATLPAGAPVWIEASAPAGTTTSTGTGTGSTGCTVPQCVGLSAGAAHNAIVAAGLKPTAPAGQKATWTCTGTTPSSGTKVACGSSVTILATSSSGSSGSSGSGTCTVPQCVGLSAGAAHNAIVAAGLKPTAPAGQKATAKCTGTAPSSGTQISCGSEVLIITS